MKRYLPIITVVLSLLSVIQAQDSAAEWSEKNAAALTEITPDTIVATLQDAAAIKALLSEFKPGGVSAPLALTRIGALTQHVMHNSQAQKYRQSYADALLQAALGSSDAETVCFMLDQLRWCGLPAQVAALAPLQKSATDSIAIMANITAASLSDTCAPCSCCQTAKTRYAILAQELEKAPVEKQMELMEKAFADPDTAYAGVALQRAQTFGAQKETAQWCQKLTAAPSPVHQIMLLDMLGLRGDQSAIQAIVNTMKGAAPEVVAAAQFAVFRISKSQFVAVMQEYLKQGESPAMTLSAENLRLLGTAELAPMLIANYNAFNTTGKRTALLLLGERQVVKALPLASTAIASDELAVAVAGLRLLREIGTSAEVELLGQELLSADAQRSEEACVAYAAAGRRDESGAYKAHLLQLLKNTDNAKKAPLLTAAARLGGKELLAVVKEAADQDDASLSTSAVRALAECSDNSIVPELLKYAVTAPDTRRQVLALRGATRMLEGCSAKTKAKALEYWQKEVSQLPGNEEHKTAIKKLFEK